MSGQRRKQRAHSATQQGIPHSKPGRHNLFETSRVAARRQKHSTSAHSDHNAAARQNKKRYAADLRLPASNQRKRYERACQSNVHLAIVHSTNANKPATTRRYQTRTHGSTAHKPRAASRKQSQMCASEKRTTQKLAKARVCFQQQWPKCRATASSDFCYLSLQLVVFVVASF